MKTSLPPWRLVEAGLSDLSDLQALEAACFEPERRSKPRNLRRALRSPTQKVWMLKGGDGEAVAAMVCLLYPKTLRIYSLCVSESCRGSGLGARLMGVSEDFAKNSGRKRLSLEAARREEQLVRWYSKLGFSIREELPDYYAPGVDALRKVKIC